ncbi:SPJ_0845 family protein [Streptococcus caviae]|nr:SPJ_0845 family protein [Streptococcus sp. 'caviae']
MAITFKKKDELEKMMENFAKLPDLEDVTFPDAKDGEQKNKQKDKK